jgi:2-keto-4-pentenoate hydratase
MKRFRSTKYLTAAAVFIVFSLFLFLSPAPAADLASTLAANYLSKTPSTAVDPAMTLEQAYKVQEQFIAKISKEYGKAVGYKAGLTNPDVQKTFGVTAPVRGTLLKKMLLKSGAEIPAQFGARPLSEGDLILRVGSAKINKAKTPDEALKCIDAAIPFIELPDLVFDKSVKINGIALVTVNVAARYGVVGKPIRVKATPEWNDRLKNFSLQILNAKDEVEIEGKGSNLLNHPLNVVLWIRDSLQAEGKELKRGDLISLGTITKLAPTKPGTVVKARYIGLDPKGPVEISVRFK